ncbi:CDP-alcohol phosphatidyltransferase family protein [Pseudokineococcus lusitanus]|uniref:Phosphatidylglycerophosphate synthase n=1 Tax=Pseudokineococcus lusitanus TaxID=763993 RepID=A0A3N1HJS5_9ACTN|nr:CDP-alcohol phosphatidyltransferase family protein [Pseudokineococcus lusitanus]ROP42783.1 phosphatidylglycerophosphate synthase [Pseudokineococcus lusitanus]
MSHASGAPVLAGGTARRDATVTGLVTVVLCGVLATWAVARSAVVPAVPGLDAVAAAVVGSALVGVAALAVARRADGWSGPADRVTLLRTVLGGGVATLVVVDLLHGDLGPSWAVVALAAPALALDGVDGAVARRTRTSTPAGARLDMEVDAGLIAVLCLPAAAVVGWWVLAVGLLRYAWVAAGQVRPALRGDLAPRLSRKVVAATQGVVLVLVAVPGLPPALATAAAAGALVALLWSFGRDAVALERAARR